MARNYGWDGSGRTASVSYTGHSGATTAILQSFADEYDQSTLVGLKFFTTTAGSSTISAPNHSFATNAAVKLLTSGSLPAPLNTTTTYYVRDVVTGSSGSFELATAIEGKRCQVVYHANALH